MADTVFATDRLILRNWRRSDALPFHAMFEDPEVMEFLGPTRSLAAVEDIVEEFHEEIASDGYGFWAVESYADGRFMGFCGVELGAKKTPIADKPEIGWRFAREFWGQGYALEAARGALAWTWNNTHHDAVWAVTVPANRRSRGLMERLGMHRRVDLDFDHPDLPDDSPLRRHVTYSVTRPSA